LQHMQETAISLVADGADCVQRPTICPSTSFKIKS